MIRIRTITYSIPEKVMEKDYRAIKKCSELFSNIKYEVHTQRVCCVPAKKIDKSFVAELAKFCEESGVRWFNLPIDLWDNSVVTSDEIREVLLENKNAFVNVICAKDAKINSDIVDFAAKQFLENGEADSDGLINFRFGASMNIAPYGPFFPFTYSGGKLRFSIGLEIAEEINDILEANSKSSDLNEIHNLIVNCLDPQIEEIEKIAQEISEECGIDFAGIDFSLAPLPKERNSVISVLNFLGIENIDDTGVLFATAFLTKLLKSFAANHKSVGFSGVMYSLIEDKVYADINNQIGFSIDRMISLSTMCGCGVDMVPIPNDTSLEAIKSVMLEIACVSSRLAKPLGVRLLPVESEDGFTHFTGEEDFCFNTRIVPIMTKSKIPFRGEYCFSIK